MLFGFYFDDQYKIENSKGICNDLEVWTRISNLY